MTFVMAGTICKLCKIVVFYGLDTHFITKQIITWVFNLTTLSANISGHGVFCFCMLLLPANLWGHESKKSNSFMCTQCTVIYLFDKIFTFFYNRECENLKAPPQQELWYCRECLCTLPKWTNYGRV